MAPLTRLQARHIAASTQQGDDSRSTAASAQLAGSSRRAAASARRGRGSRPDRYYKSAERMTLSRYGFVALLCVLLLFVFVPVGKVYYPKLISASSPTPPSLEQASALAPPCHVHGNPNLITPCIYKDTLTSLVIGLESNLHDAFRGHWFSRLDYLHDVSGLLQEITRNIMAELRAMLHNWNIPFLRNVESQRYQMFRLARHTPKYVMSKTVKWYMLCQGHSSSEYVWTHWDNFHLHNRTVWGKLMVWSWCKAYYPQSRWDGISNVERQTYLDLIEPWLREVRNMLDTYEHRSGWLRYNHRPKVRRGLSDIYYTLDIIAQAVRDSEWPDHMKVKSYGRVFAHFQAIEARYLVWDAGSTLFLAQVDATIDLLGRLVAQMVSDVQNVIEPSCLAHLNKTTFPRHNETTSHPTSIERFDQIVQFLRNMSPSASGKCFTRASYLHHLSTVSWPRQSDLVVRFVMRTLPRDAMRRWALDHFEHCALVDASSGNASSSPPDPSGQGCHTHPTPFMRRWFTFDNHSSSNDSSAPASSEDVALDAFWRHLSGPLLKAYQAPKAIRVREENSFLSQDVPAWVGILDEKRMQTKHRAREWWRKDVCVRWEDVIPCDGEGCEDEALVRKEARARGERDDEECVVVL